MKFLEKIRSLSEGQKKAIIWLIIVLGAIGLGWWWFDNAARHLQEFNAQKAAEQLDLEKLKSSF